MYWLNAEFCARTHDSILSPWLSSTSRTVSVVSDTVNLQIPGTRLSAVPAPFPASAPVHGITVPFFFETEKPSLDSFKSVLTSRHISFSKIIALIIMIVFRLALLFCSASSPPPLYCLFKMVVNNHVPV